MPKHVVTHGEVNYALIYSIHTYHDYYRDLSFEKIMKSTPVIFLNNNRNTIVYVIVFTLSILPE